MQPRFEKSEKHTGIPYVPAKRQFRENYGYIDLQRNPERVNEVPEIQGEPELREFVMEINHRRSLFRSAGCDTNYGPHAHPVYKYGMSCFVTMVFEIVDWNCNAAAFEGVYEEFCRFLSQVPHPLPEPVEVIFEQQYVTFGEHGGKKALGLTVDVRSWGRDEADARRIWANALRIVQRFFAESRQKHHGSLDNGAVTVS